MVKHDLFDPAVPLSLNNVDHRIPLHNLLADYDVRQNNSNARSNKIEELPPVHIYVNAIIRALPEVFGH
jgi:hypothetical protein